ncbi:hypothetical protein POL44_003894 [Shigella sonnei]|nr:hypothetical protein [Shigella sonnei]EKK6974121.1 hypothetical protein [Shigella sonnei]
MKKTLIALAVAASAAVSGSAMAWTASGTGGDVNFGGTLTPSSKVTPWETRAGAGVMGLDAEVTQGQRSVQITTPHAVEILSIRTKDAKAFQGGVNPGINPQIDFHGAAGDFNAGKSRLSMEARNTEGVKIGSVTVAMSAGAMGSTSKGAKNDIYAPDAGYGFFGGVGKTSAQTLNNAHNFATSQGFNDVVANFDTQGVVGLTSDGTYNFNETSRKYSAFYIAAVASGEKFTVTLDNPVSGDGQIQWKASLPVTVSYQ